MNSTKREATYIVTRTTSGSVSKEVDRHQTLKESPKWREGIQTSYAGMLGLQKVPNRLEVIIMHLGQENMPIV